MHTKSGECIATISRQPTAQQGTFIEFARVKKRDDSFSDKVGKSKVVAIAEKIVKDTFDELIKNKGTTDGGVLKGRIELFIKIMQELTENNVKDKDVAGEGAGFTYWKQGGASSLIGGKIKEHCPEIENVEDVIKLFSEISTQMQKKSSQDLDTISGRKYIQKAGKGEIGARSFRIVNALPENYKIGNGQTI